MAGSRSHSGLPFSRRGTGRKDRTREDVSPPSLSVVPTNKKKEGKNREIEAPVVFSGAPPPQGEKDLPRL